ncbi:zinc finger CCCH domain-containing protein 9-like [Salvia divinorum]|uniref:Zinc finger CCCH domain-containing protein 9-like n=1 Tax=Salvia divinorum TaxID=28513 RepID=A0ABD1ID50_SALDI
MQREDVSYDSLLAADKSAAASLLFSFTNPTSPTYVNSFYSSLFQNHSSSTTSDTASFDDGGDDTDRRLQDASCVVEYQQLYNRYTLCLAQLHDSIEEADALRRDNESLRLSNADLSHRIALLFSRDRLLSDFSRLSVASPSAAAHLSQPLAEHNRVERRSIERVTLPKSISVRTSGYLKMTRPGRETTGDKALSQPTAELREQQKVYVGGSTAENVEELDVYNQGMTKTELCNKWQETGACPYGENCQFAHGINELRPVIRHPRYKTEVCRMVLAGDVCPYGHRCHFRHSLTEEERLMVAPPR